LIAYLALIFKKMRNGLVSTIAIHHVLTFPLR